MVQEHQLCEQRLPAPEEGEPREGVGRLRDRDLGGRLYERADAGFGGVEEALTQQAIDSLSQLGERCQRELMVTGTPAASGEPALASRPTHPGILPAYLSRFSGASS